MPNESQSTVTLDPNYTVICQVVDAQQNPLTGLRVQAFDKDPVSPDDPLGQPAITGADGKATFRFKSSDLSEGSKERGPELYFQIDRDDTRLEHPFDGQAIEKTLRNFKPQKAPIVIRVDRHYVLNGRVFFEYGLPASGIELLVYNRGFGESKTLLGRATIDSQGFYTLTYNPGTEGVNLDVRVKDPQDTTGNQEISLLSTPKLNAPASEPLNLVVPATLRPLAPEFDRLAADVNRQLKGFSNVAKAKETTEQRDLTFLHQTTGWDARLLALAALAAKNADTGIPQDALYALYRIGLPTDKEQLVLVQPETIEAALKKARSAGIISIDDPKIAQVKVKFQLFVEKQAVTFRRQFKTPGTLSTFGELLDNIDWGTNQNQKAEFEKLYSAHRGNAQELWAKATAKGINVQPLQLQGKLAHLSFNNAPLCKKLQAELTKRLTPSGLRKVAKLSLSDRFEVLIDLDYDKEETWIKTLKELAQQPGQSQEKLIPPIYVDSDVEKNLKAYAADLARKVRLSFPTQVVRRLIERNELKLSDSVKTNVVQILKETSGLGFELGRTPVKMLLERYEDTVFQGMDQVAKQATLATLKRLARLYQITPSDQALIELHDLGFQSAQDVIAFPLDLFVKKFSQQPTKSLLPAGHLAQEAVVIYQKAQQVAAVSTHLVVNAQLLTTLPPLYALSGDLAKYTKSLKYASDNLQSIVNVETLFGSLDFCECEHCRSVLSPAAYFVDLLKWLDVNDLVWAEIVAKWETEHHGVPYPFNTQDERTEWQNNHPNQESTPKKPYDILASRRPDLPALQLTCENTNTTLPYIDVVNEILEYYVAHNELKQDAVHNVEDATTSELLAEPQHLLEEAYQVLETATYPTTLPFDLPLEITRQFLNHFDIPLWQFLELFITTDKLFDTDAICDRASIQIESLGFTPAEYTIFTKFDPLEWRELYGDKSSTLSANSSVKQIAQCLGVSYQNLLDVIQTKFISPSDQSRLLFHYASDSSNLEKAILKFSDGRSIQDLDFLKINLFTRLWKKLGWTFQELDRSLQVFLPKNLTASLEGGSLRKGLETFLIYLSHLKALDEQLSLGKDSRLKLLNFWADLDTNGKNSLYAQLFLRSSILKNDDIFDHPEGKYLCYETQGKFLPYRWNAEPNRSEDRANGYVSLKNHCLSLQAALNLTAVEIQQILTDANISFELAPLTLANVSLLYRYGVFAKALGISVDDLIVLKQLSGLDPFKALILEPVSSIEDDYPYSQTLQLLEVIQKIKASGFSIEDLNYLFCHRFDPVGQYRDCADAPLTLIQELATGIEKIYTDHAIPQDLTTEILRQKVSLVLPANAVETLLGMITNRIEYTATQEVEAHSKLEPTSFEQEPSLQGSYNSPVQTLVFKGILLNSEKVRLSSKYPSALFTALLEQIQKQAQLFFDEYLLKRDLSGNDLVGFLSSKDFEVLFAPLPHIAKTLTDNQIQENEQAIGRRREDFAKKFFPYLQQVLIRQHIIQTLATTLKADSQLVEALLTNPALLRSPNSDQLLLNSFTPLGQLGNISGSPDKLNPREIESLQEAARAIQKPWVLLSKAVQLIQGWKLNLSEVHYILTHKVDFDDIDLNRLPFQDAQKDKENARNELESLVKRYLQDYATQLPKDAKYAWLEALERVRQKRPDLQQEIDRMPKFLKQFLRLADYVHLKRTLSPNTDDLINLFESARQVYLDLTKANLSQKEKILFETLLQKIATLTRRDVATVRLVAQHLKFAPPFMSDLQNRWLKATDFAQERGIAKLWQVLQVVEKLGVSVDELTRWTNIVSAPSVWKKRVTPRPTKSFVSRMAIAHSVRNAIQSRYPEEDWLRVVQPISDRLRQQRRDALVAYIMHREHFESINQLFEYFLIDPGMEPIVQTSRIQLAISSVQLFIQRCLLNLEPLVAPSTINAQQWQWMKRYRVWEANRKIFLYPENWLEPEFRDDKTHLFQELENTLLQGDVSNELAEKAFFDYLKKLESLARLEIVTLYCEQDANSPGSSTLHVIGRTYGLPHKYFYRRYANNMWTPWEPVTTEIEGDHIVAVVWKERLHLFWATFMETPEQKALEGKSPADVMNEPVSQAIRKRIEIQLHWSEYFQGQWTPRQSSGFYNNPNSPVIVGSESFDGNNVFIRALQEDTSVLIQLRAAVTILPKNQEEWQDLAVFEIKSKNAPPKLMPADEKYQLQLPYPNGTPEATYYRYNGSLKVDIANSDAESILSRNHEFFLVMHNTEGKNGQNNPFFYQDADHTFFVELVTSEPSPSTSQSGVGIDVHSPEIEVQWNLDDIQVVHQIPIPIHEQFTDPSPVDSYTKPDFALKQDWVTHSSVVFQFDGRFLTSTGSFEQDDFSSSASEVGHLGFNTHATGRLTVTDRGLTSTVREQLRKINSVHGFNLNQGYLH